MRFILISSVVLHRIKLSKFFLPFIFCFFLIFSFPCFSERASLTRPPVITANVNNMNQQGTFTYNYSNSQYLRFGDSDFSYPGIYHRYVNNNVQNATYISLTFSHVFDGFDGQVFDYMYLSFCLSFSPGNSYIIENFLTGTIYLMRNGVNTLSVPMVFNPTLCCFYVQDCQVPFWQFDSINIFISGAPSSNTSQYLFLKNFSITDFLVSTYSSAAEDVNEIFHDYFGDHVDQSLIDHSSNISLSESLLYDYYNDFADEFSAHVGYLMEYNSALTYQQDIRPTLLIFSTFLNGFWAILPSDFKFVYIGLFLCSSIALISGIVIRGVHHARGG